MGKGYAKRILALFSVLTSLFAVQLASAEPSPAKVSKAKWYYVETDNFTIVTDVSRKNAARLAQNLEKFRSLVALFNGGNFPAHARSVKVYVTDSSRNYDLLTSYNERLENTGGFFRDTLNGNYAVMRYHDASSISTLFHEYTHYLTSNLTDRNFPLWYNEGLAEFLGEMEFRKDNVVLYGNLNKYHLANIGYRKWLNVETLFKIRYLDRSDRVRTGLIYSMSWLAVHYFKSEPELARQLKTYLQLTQNGVGEADAVQQSMGIGFEELNLRIKAYSRKRRLEYTKITLKDPLTETQLQVVKLDRAEAAYQLGEYFLQAGYDPQRAEKYFDESLDQNPQHVGALAGKANLAMFRCKEDNCESAISWITKAKDIDPKNAFVSTISGHINSAMVRASNDESDKKRWWNAAARDYNAAINSGTVNLEAISAAASMYARDNRWENAYGLYEIVYFNAPSNHNARLNMIIAHLAKGENHLAQAIADKVRNNNHFSDRSLKAFEKWFEKEVTRYGSEDAG